VEQVKGWIEKDQVLLAKHRLWAAVGGGVAGPLRAASYALDKSSGGGGVSAKAGPRDSARATRAARVVMVAPFRIPA
jgi:hypothetical protein